jgi:excisionase family DNA binding protein
MEQDLKLGYSRKGAATQLSVSARTVDYWISKGRLKAIKLGKRVVIPGTELVRVLKEGLPS